MQLGYEHFSELKGNETYGYVLLRTLKIIHSAIYPSRSFSFKLLSFGDVGPRNVYHLLNVMELDGSRLVML